MWVVDPDHKRNLTPHNPHVTLIKSELITNLCLARERRRHRSELLKFIFCYPAERKRKFLCQIWQRITEIESISQIGLYHYYLPNRLFQDCREALFSEYFTGGVKLAL
jgi:hypothetical protein